MRARAYTHTHVPNSRRAHLGCAINTPVLTPGAVHSPAKSVRTARSSGVLTHISLYSSANRFFLFFLFVILSLSPYYSREFDGCRSTGPAENRIKSVAWPHQFRSVAVAGFHRTKHIRRSELDLRNGEKLLATRRGRR